VVAGPVPSVSVTTGLSVVGSPLVRFDHSHHPIIAATARRMMIISHGAPRFLSSIRISATVPPHKLCLPASDRSLSVPCDATTVPRTPDHVRVSATAREGLAFKKKVMAYR
jgi:hypothetical protein